MNVTVVSRQRAAHTALLLTGAATWLVGNLLYALGNRPAMVVPWWFSFLVLTIAAERLEMTRLMRRRRGAAATLCTCLGLVLTGSAAFAWSPVWGGWLYGLSLTGLAAWLVCFDIARRTVAADGLSRYMAVCLLLGYAWLAVSGLAWMATSLGLRRARRGAACARPGLRLQHDARPRAGHPAGTGPRQAAVRLVLLRPAGASCTPRWRSGCSLGPVRLPPAAAPVPPATPPPSRVFAVTVAGSAAAWRLKHPASPRQRHAIPAPH